jgi:hypothetical protein
MPASFSREEACAIVGIPVSTLIEWERQGCRNWGPGDDRPFALSDLLALAVIREMARCLGPRLNDFAFGVGQLFQALAARTDMERADDLSAVIGPHFAFLWKIHEGDDRSRERDMVVVPLRPLLADFRNQVFP